MTKRTPKQPNIKRGTWKPKEGSEWQEMVSNPAAQVTEFIESTKGKVLGHIIRTGRLHCMASCYGKAWSKRSTKAPQSNGYTRHPNMKSAETWIRRRAHILALGDQTQKTITEE